MDRPILRIVASPGAAEVNEYTGGDLVTAANALVADQLLTEDSKVVLLLLPHSPELFLLHLGLVLNGKVPAILPWPTTRVDAEKYQRNLLYQLSSLPAHHLITLPRLGENLRPGLPYSASGCSIARAAQFEKVFTERFYAEVCTSAILNSAPFRAWPRQMQLDIGADHRDVQFTFFYENE